MAVTAIARIEHTLSRRSPGTGSRFVLPTGILAAGFGVVLIVGRDGTGPWRTARVVAVSAVGALLFLALRRLRGSRRGIALFSAGAVAFAIGVGVGMPHASKVGFSAVTAAGLLTLVGGLVLALSGAAALVRATHRWWRLVTVPVLVLSSVTVLYSLGQAVAATNVPRTEVGPTTPADRGLPYRDVEFPAADGVTLSGWYVPSENGSAVVLLHGAGSTRSGVLDHAVVLARHRYGVLLYDARGHGRSDGRAMDFGWYGDVDIAGAVAFLEAQDDVDAGRIAAIGMSMGGEQAIGAAATNERIKAVVAEGATNRVAGDKAWLSEQFGLRGDVQERLDWLTYCLADLFTAADPPITLGDAVRAAAPRPVLLIAGGSVADEPRAARSIQHRAPATVELWVVPETGHTNALHTHPDGWESRVVTFLDHAFNTDMSGDSALSTGGN
jgi:pimeloyl-ACP methyl ester carboxylesterase